MRNLKKLLAVIVAVCTILTFTVPAFAADAGTLSAAAQTCKDIGMLQGPGGGVTPQYTATVPTRIQAAVMVLRLKGLEADAKAFTGTDNFKDASKAAWAKPIMAYLKAHPELGFVGDGVNFDPASPVTAQQYYKVVLTALGYTQKDAAGTGDFAYADVVAFAKDTAKLAMAGNVESFTIDSLAAATVEGLKATVKGATDTLAATLVKAGKLDEAAAVAAGLYSTNVGISSVTATAADTLVVKLSAAVDTSKAVLTVKSGTSTVTMGTPTWSADKTTATLVKSYKFSAGDYTVTLSGIDKIDTAAASKTITLKDQTVTTISILGQDIVQNATGDAATFNYVVKDQYGNDMTSVSNISATSSLGVTPNLSASSGVGTINYAFATNTAVTAVVVSLVDGSTGVNTTATLNVAKSANVASIAFGDLVFPANVTRLTTGNATAATVPLTVKDQYGNLVKSLSVLGNAITVISSDQTHVQFTFASDANGNPVLSINTSSATDSSTVVATLVVKANGKTYSQSFAVAKPATPDKVILGDPVTTDVFAKGDTGIVLPITVVDQFGNTMSASDVAAQATAVNNIVSVSGSIITDPTVVTDPNSANYGKMTFNATGTGTAMIVASSTSGVNTKSVTVTDARVATSIDNLASSSLMQGANKDLKFVFRDQYGKVQDPPTNSALTYAITLTKVSGDDNCVTTAHTSTGALVASAAAINVVAGATLTGSYKVQLDLKDATSGAVKASASTTITVVKNNVTGLTYSIDAIPTLAADKNYTYTDSEARKLVLTAKDAAGVSYTINSADIISATSSDTSVAGVTINSGDIYVYGNSGAVLADTSASTKTATITVKLNTLDGIKTVTVPVTVSEAAPSVQTLKIVAETIAANNSAVAWIQGSLPGDCSDALTYLPTASSLSTSGISVNLVGQDQYGVWSDLTTTAGFTVVVNSTDVAAANALTLGYTSPGVFTLTGVIPTGSDVKVTLIKDSGSVQIIVHTHN